MKRRRFLGLVVVTLCLLILKLSANSPTVTSAQPDVIEAAWQRVLAIGAYGFTVDVEQALAPPPDPQHDRADRRAGGHAA
jgi:hypothetical protein